MRPDDNIKITIHLQRRPDGGLRAWSDDMPGLVLSHRDPERVLEDIIPAVETIVSEMTGQAMKASPLVPLPTAGKPVRDKHRHLSSFARFMTSLSLRAAHHDEVREMWLGRPWPDDRRQVSFAIEVGKEASIDRRCSA